MISKFYVKKSYSNFIRLILVNIIEFLASIYKHTHQLQFFLWGLSFKSEPVNPILETK